MDEESDARAHLEALVPASDLDAVLALTGTIFVARFKRLMDLDRVEYMANAKPTNDTGVYEQLIEGQMRAARWAACKDV